MRGAAVHTHRIHLPHVHVPHVHVPHVHVPHPDLRHLARDLAIAAEVALASVALTGSIEAASHLSLHPGAATSGAGAPPAAAQIATAPAAAVTTVRIDVEAGAAGPVARVRVPQDGVATLRVLDASGAPVADLAAPYAAVALALAPGTYRVLASHAGPVETVGDTAIASSSVVRSELLTVAEGARLTVEVVTG